MSNETFYLPYKNLPNYNTQFADTLNRFPDKKNRANYNKNGLVCGRAVCIQRKGKYGLMKAMIAFELGA